MDANQNNEYPNEVVLSLFYIHGECNKVVKRTCRIFNERYPHMPTMNPRKFRRLESNFLRFGTVKCKKNVNKPITEDEIHEINVLAYFSADPRSSVRSASVDLGISYPSISRIMAKHKWHDFSFVPVQHLRDEDYALRLNFCEWLLVKTQEDPAFLQNIIWSDESKFSKEGVTNRRNWHFWALENPHAIRPRNYQVNFSFNVFAMMVNNRIHYHIYNENLTANLFLSIIRNVILPFLETLPGENYWFQLDGAPAHSTHDVYMSLTNVFEDRWIGPRGPWRWPPRSPDLTPLDFYLWGRVKNKVYFTPVASREDLELRVRRAFDEMDAVEIREATTNGVHRRIQLCIEKNGGHIEQNLY